MACSSISAKVPGAMPVVKQVLPAMFKNQLILAESPTITLIDYQKRSFRIEVEEGSRGTIKIHGDGWKNFAKFNLRKRQEIASLCFRWVAEDKFEVFCFNSQGIELDIDSRNEVYMKRCLLKAAVDTVEKQYFPEGFLKDLNEKAIRGEVLKVKIGGPKQNCEANLIFNMQTTNPELPKWKADGIEGARWSNFVIMNGIEQGLTMMVTNMRDKTFTIEVFNKRGIGMTVKFFPESDLANYVELDDSDSDSSDSNNLHTCRLVNHNHISSRPHVLLKLGDNQLSTKNLTIPSKFVKSNQLYNYSRGQLVYGSLGFDVELVIKKDDRRPADRSHMVMKFEWRRLMRSMGVGVGDEIRLELNTVDSKVGEVVVFNVC